MSAICGIFNLDGKPVIRDHIVDLNNQMVRHGANSNDVWLNGKCGLGSQMTYLTPESLTERLPLIDKQHEISLVSDCRLFNRHELCNWLNVTDSIINNDSQLLLLAYLKWGKDFVKYLLGEYSIAIWNEKLQELVCVTDHFASRQISYYVDNNSFIFATDVHALFVLPNVPQELDYNEIARCDYFGFERERNHTFFAGVKCLTGAKILTVNYSGCKIEQYWYPQIGQELSFKSEDEYCEAFQEVFTKVIKGATRTHLPICSTLSGGLDSSAITAMACKIMESENRQLISLSAVLSPDYVGAAKDEGYYIQMLKVPNLIMQSVYDEWRGPFDNVYGGWSPLLSSRHYLYGAFNARARDAGARVILEGVLGEVCVSKHSNEYLVDLFKCGNWVKLFGELSAYRSIYSRSSIRFLLYNTIRALPRPLQAIFPFSDNSRKRLDYLTVRPEFIKESIGQRQFELESQKLKIHEGYKTVDVKKNSLDLINYCLGGYQPNFDDGGGDSTIYYSRPYLNKSLVEFCLKVPASYWFRHGYSRYMIRGGMKDIMPNEICWRTTKLPFSPDYRERYRRHISKAKDVVAEVERSDIVRRVVDIPRLKELLGYSEADHSQDYQFIIANAIPRIIYLAKFVHKWG